MRKLLAKLMLAASLIVVNGIAVTAEGDEQTDANGSENKTAETIDGTQETVQKDDTKKSETTPDDIPSKTLSDTSETDSLSLDEATTESENEEVGNATDLNTDDETNGTEEVSVDSEDPSEEDTHTYKLDAIPSDAINDYITRITEYINENNADEESDNGSEHTITQVIFSYRISDKEISTGESDPTNETTPENDASYPLEHDVVIDKLAYSGEDKLMLFKISGDELTEVLFEQDGFNDFTVRFHNTAGDYMLIAAGEKETEEEVELLAPNALVTIEEGTETPDHFEASATKGTREIYDAANKFMNERYRRLLRPIMIQHISFDESDSINMHEEYAFDPETKTQVSVMTGGTVRMKASNVEYDLKDITYFETIWISEDMSDAAITNHSVFGNDIFFTMNQSGYLIAAEAEWLGTPEPENQIDQNKPLLSNMQLRDLPLYAPAHIGGIYGLNAFNALAAPTTNDNTTITVVWAGDTVSTRAAASTVHIIHGVLTINGVAPDANGNVNVACIYGTETGTQDTCFSVGTDVPENVDWDTLNGQDSQIEAIKQQLGID